MTTASHKRLGAALVMLALLLAVFVPVADGEELQPPPQPPVLNAGAPTIAGTPALGKALTCSTGAWSGNPDSFAYVWLRDGAPVAGQTASTYTVGSADVGHSLSCMVTAANSGGEYVISGLESGSYKVSFSSGYEAVAGNYLPEYFSGKPSFEAADAVSVTAPNMTVGVNAALSVGGVMTGKVSAAEGGAALAGLYVCAESELSYGCATTDASGEYRIVGLASGNYLVMFFGAEENGLNYAPQFYREKTHLKEYVPVAVTAGSTTGGIDAQLQAGARIAGIVSDKGAPIAEATVCAFEEGEGESGDCVRTDAKGEYTALGLAAGEYELFFCRDSCSAIDYLEATATGIPVSAGGTAHRNQELVKGGKILGEVKEAGGTKQPLASIEVCAEPAQGGATTCSPTDSSGKFALGGLSGEYRVSFSGRLCGGATCAAQNYAYKEYNSGAIVTVTAGKETSLSPVSMGIGGQIHGTVSDSSSHAPLAKIEVCDAGPAYACTDTNAAGEYALVGLPTGTYEVEFYSRDLGNYLKDEIGAVAVTEGSITSGVSAQLLPGAQITGRVVAAVGGMGVPGVEVCADGASTSRCAATSSPSGSASATSATVAVPSAGPLAPVLVFKKAKFDAKTDDIDFVFSVSASGKLGWSLSFRNADVGFADALRKTKAKKCKKGEIKHHGKCKRELVPFSSGSRKVAAGTVEVKVHADAAAIKALKSGRTLHVSGSFKFQSSLGGKAVAHNYSAIVRPPKKGIEKSKKRRR